MAAGRKNVLRIAAVAGLCPLVAVAGFSVPVRSGVRAASAGTGTAIYTLPSDASPRSRHATTTSMAALGAASSTAAKRGPDFGDMLGDKVASAIVNSPVYPFLIKQAKDTMKKSAEVRLALFTCDTRVSHRHVSENVRTVIIILLIYNLSLNLRT